MVFIFSYTELLFQMKYRNIDEITNIFEICDFMTFNEEIWRLLCQSNFALLFPAYPILFRQCVNASTRRLLVSKW